MILPGFEHCTNERQLGLGVEVIYNGQKGLVEWNEEYRSDFYTGLHPLTANEPFKIVLENGDILYPCAAIRGKQIFHVKSMPFRVGSRVRWGADGDWVSVTIRDDEEGIFVERDDELGASTNRWRALPDIQKYIGTVIKY